MTLIELLVVMAIIVLLVSLVVPALGGARDRVRTVQCANNLRQWGMTYKIFSMDNGGQYAAPHQNAATNRLPQDRFNIANSNTTQYVVAGLLVFAKNYIGNRGEIFYCPANRFTYYKKDWKYPANLSNTRGSYTWYARYIPHVSSSVFTGYTDETNMSTKAFAQDRHSAFDKIVIMDNCLSAPGGVQQWGHPIPRQQNTPRGGNLLFNDGRAEWRNASEMQMRWQETSGYSYYF